MGRCTLRAKPLHTLAHYSKAPTRKSYATIFWGCTGPYFGPTTTDEKIIKKSLYLNPVTPILIHPSINQTVSFYQLAAHLFDLPLHFSEMLIINMSLYSLGLAENYSET